jgi:signal transduction histidine kinase
MTETVQMALPSDTRAEVRETPGRTTTSDGWLPRLFRDTGYNLASFFIAVPLFVLVVAGFSIGVATLVIVLGLLVLALTMRVARGFAGFERFRVRSLDKPAPSPTYLSPAPGTGWFRRWVTPLRDPQSWLDLTWGVGGFVTGIASFVTTVAWWAAAAGGLTYWFWERWLPFGPHTHDTLAYQIGLGAGREPEKWLNFCFGVAALETLPFAVRFATAMHAGLARLLLSSRAELQQEISRVEAGRAAARVAEATSLRRLERDIHDGPQQRLVRLSMDIGRARKQVDADPDAAREILDGALLQARDTVDELRSLSRGIAPPVLVDRGLAAAIDEVVNRSPVPVASHVVLGTELPPHLETCVYFVVSEALTNVAKHSGAHAVAVDVTDEEVPGRVVVRVADDGRGGAHVSKGNGLAGLAERVQAADGVLAVVSPEGGPTVVEAELPCA